MATQDYGHPLPVPPPQGHQQQQYTYSQAPLPQQPLPTQQYQGRQPQSAAPAYQPGHSSQPSKQERNRPKSRAFSFRSDHSHKSSRSSGHYKIDLHETSEEKEKKRLHSKADPTLAMNEAEPATVALQTANYTDHTPLRSLQHKDAYGNPIADPDRSNPTRSRWERPLDTIRSFEAAIDGDYSRKSVYRADSESVANWNKRGSYYGNNGPRFPQDSYYGTRPNSAFRPESMMDPRGSVMMNGNTNSVYDNNDGGGYSNGNGGRYRYPRNQSEPQLNNRPAANKNVYPVPNNYRSYETVGSGSGSASVGEPSGYQTDPTSSDNSSIDRRSPAKPREPQNDYGISFAQPPSYQPPTFAQASQPRTMPNMLNVNAGAPPPPRKDAGNSLLRKATNNDSGGKRKSWFSRRFSKTN